MSLSPLAEVIAVLVANTVVAWLVNYLVHSTVLIAAAWLLDRRIHLAGSDRAFLWRFAIVAPPLSAAAHVLAGGAWAPLSMEARPVSTILGSHSMESLALACVAIGLPLAGACLVIGSHIRFLITVGRRVPAGDAETTLLSRVSAAAGRSAAALTVSPRIAAPAAIGIDEICLPETLFSSLPTDEQEALMAHELGHLARRDPVWLAMATAVTWVLAVQPANRVALGRLREASEHAADDFAVRVTRDPGALARALATLATVIVAASPAFHGACTSAAGSPLLRRVVRLLSSNQEVRAPISLRVRMLSAVGAVVALTLAAPGVEVSVTRACHAIPWLAPSKLPPNARMLEIRRLNRALRDALRGGTASSAAAVTRGVSIVR